MSAESLPKLEVISCGVLPYREAWDLQSEIHREIVAGRRGPCLLLLEHPAVLTLGKHSDPVYIVSRLEDLKARNIEIVKCDRGGEVTAHMPGQLVVYPLLPLNRLRLAPKIYVERLLRTVILTLQDFAIEAYSDSRYPGVWVGGEKICAVGVRIREKVSMHGLALNIDNDLSIFETIVACGIKERGVCSMQSILKVAPTRASVEARFVHRFFEIFDWQKVIN